MPRAPACHRALHRFFHGAAEADLLFQLHGHAFGHQLRVQFRPLDFHDVHEGFAVGHGLDIFAQIFNVGALFADHNARASRINIDPQVFAGALNADLGDGGAFQLSLQILADPAVFFQKLRHLAEVKPPGIPIIDVAEAQAPGMNFLSHLVSSSTWLSGRSSTIVIWALWWRIVAPRPMACARMRFMVGP